MNDIGAYRRACDELLDFQGRQRNPEDTINYVAWACVLAPDVVVDREAVVLLAQRKGLRLRRPTHIATLDLQILGAATYRAGRFDEAARHLDEGIKAQGKGGDLRDWLFLAMAHQRLGDAVEARRWLDKAIDWLDSSTRDKPKDDTLDAEHDTFGSGQLWIALQGLVGVARRGRGTLVKGSKADAPPVGP